MNLLERRDGVVNLCRPLRLLLEPRNHVEVEMGRKRPQVEEATLGQQFPGVTGQDDVDEEVFRSSRQRRRRSFPGPRGAVVVKVTAAATGGLVVAVGADEVLVVAAAAICGGGVFGGLVQGALGHAG